MESTSRGQLPVIALREFSAVEFPCCAAGVVLRPDFNLIKAFLIPNNYRLFMIPVGTPFASRRNTTWV